MKKALCCLALLSLAFGAFATSTNTLQVLGLVSVDGNAVGANYNVKVTNLNKTSFTATVKTGVDGKYVATFVNFAVVSVADTGDSIEVAVSKPDNIALKTITATYNSGGTVTADVAAVTPVVATAPSAPTNLLASIGASNGSVNLSWTDTSSTETGFEIEKKIGAGTFAAQTTTAANSISFTDTFSLQADVTYTYRVRAVNGSGQSAWSNEVIVGFATTLPTAPTSLVATVNSPTSVTLAWQNTAANAASVKIGQAIGVNAFGVVATLAATATTTTITNLTPSTEYRFRVGASNAAGDNWGSPVTVTTSAVTQTVIAPNAPTNLVATANSATAITVSWTDNSSDEEGFEIERKEGSGSFSALVTVAANTPSYQNTGLTSGVTYTYRVRAAKTGAPSAWTAEVSVTTPIPPPSAPLNLTAGLASSTQINLAWQDNSSSETGFEVQQAIGNSAFAIVTTTAANVITLQVSGLAAGADYKFRVRAIGPGGQSAWSNEATTSIPLQPPAAPSNLTATTNATATKVTLVWQNNAASATEIEVQRKTGTGVFGKIGSVASNITTFDDATVTQGASYTYRALARTATNASDFSNEVTVNVPISLPAVPSNFAVTAVSDTQVTLAWVDNSSNEANFEIERKTGAGAFTALTTTAANATTFNDSGLTAQTAYTYRLRAKNGGGTSNWVEATVTTPAPLPGTPSNLVSSVISATQINLGWQDNALTETGFEIWRREGGGEFQRIGTTAPNAITFQDVVVAGTVYAYKVRAINAGGGSAFSNEVSATTPVPALPVPAAPSELSGESITTSGVTLKWRDNSAIETGFVIERRIGNGAFASIKTVAVNIASYRDEGLQSSVSYSYRVKATSANGDSEWSNILAITTASPPTTVVVTISPPASPKNLKTKVNPEKTGIVLSWEADSSSEANYFLERKEKSELNFISLGFPEGGSSARTFTDLTAKANVVYDYRIFAVNSGGNSTPSDIQGTIDTLAPEIKNMKAEPAIVKNGDTVKFTVDTEAGLSVSADVSELDTARKEKLVFSQVEGTIGLYQGTMTVQAVVNGVKKITIIGRDIADNETQKEFVVELLNPPTVPPKVVATTSTTAVTLVWDEVDKNADSILVFRRGPNDKEFGVVATYPRGVSSFKDEGLIPGTLYVYIVTAMNKNGKVASKEVAAKTEEIDLPQSTLTLNLHQGINLVSIPLKIQGMKRLSDVYKALDGTTDVNLVAGFDAQTQKFASFSKNVDAGSKVDLELGDTTALIIIMSKAKSATFIGTPVPTEKVTLVKEVNLVGIPRNAVAKVSEIANKAPDNITLIIYERDSKFIAYIVETKGPDTDVTGGRGFVIVAKEPAELTFSGKAWQDEPKKLTAPSRIAKESSSPIFVVEGMVMAEGAEERSAEGPDKGRAEEKMLPLNHILVEATNLRTNNRVEGATGTAGNGKYSLTFMNFFNEEANIHEGDQFEIRFKDPTGKFISESVRRVVTAEDIKQNRLSGIKSLGEQPTKSALLQNFPNPFNPETWIPFQLKEASNVRITIFSVSGELIRTLDLGALEAGSYKNRAKAAYWDGTNQLGERVASGLYLYRITAGSYVATRRMIVMK